MALWGSAEFDSPPPLMLLLSHSLSLITNTISGHSWGISLWILYQPGIRSESHTHTHTPLQTHPDRAHTQHVHFKHCRNTAWSEHTFISRRQLAIEYMTRLRRDLQSLSDAEAEWEDKDVCGVSSAFTKHTCAHRREFTSKRHCSTIQFTDFH